MSEQARARLETRGGRALDMLSVKLSGDLRGLLFEASVEQRFCNPTDKNIEIVYSFPLPWGAVLLGVDVLLGDQHLTGVVIQKKLAAAHYEEALSNGNAAIMLEKNHDHSYSLNLGNLAAREQCVITLRYAQTLQFEQRGLRLLIPTVIAPRYGHSVRHGGLMPHQTPTHNLEDDHRFELAVTLHGDLAQARVSSPSHAVRIFHGTREADDVLTILLARRAALDRDFILVVDQLAHDSFAMIALDRMDAERVAILASFAACIRAPQTTSTAVKILVDCSGSMAGDSIDAAQGALQAIIRQLSAQDHFSLSRFGSTVEHRSRALWKATATTQLTAQRWVADLNADMGGTEMEGALTSTFALAHAVASDVLLVTDGEISAIDSTIEAAKKSGHRLFVVGIGSSPAESHLRRLAEATCGACDFVAPGEAVEPAVLRMFARLRSPRLSNVRIEWPAGITPEWVSPLPPCIFNGDTVHVYALFKQLPDGRVRLLGTHAGGATSQVIGEASLGGEMEIADTLSRLAAAVRIQSIATSESPRNEAADATRLALGYQLVTDHTNFLLVHERQAKHKAIEMPELRKIAQMIPAGWSGASSVLASPERRFVETRVSQYHVAEPLQWDDVETPSAHVFSMRLAPYAVSAAIHDPGMPAFLHKRIEPAARNNPQHWTKSEHYAGLTPLGLSEWLRITPVPEWPTTFLGLRQIGLGAGLVDWLELSVAACEHSAHTESQVVGTFLYLMSRPETHAALTRSQDFLGTINASVPRLRGIRSYPPIEYASSNPARLVATLTGALNGMTASAWPERVFALSGMVGKAHESKASAALG